MEKIKPSESLSSISSLKFQKKTDYKKFLNFIKSETEELEKIGAPSEDKIKNILKVGGIGLLGFGLFNLLGKKDKGDKEKIEGKGESGDFQIPFGIGRQTNDLPKTVLPNIKPFGEKPTGQSQKIKIKTPVTKKVSKPARTQVKNRVRKNINVRKKVTVGNQTIIKPKPGEIEKSKNILKKFPEQLRLFEDKDKNVPDDGGKAGQARIEKEYGLSDSERVTKGLGDADPGKQLKGQFSDLKTKRENVVKNKGDIVKKGFFQSIKSDFKKPTLGINTMEDMFSKLRLGKKTDLFKANPKGMNLFKLGTFSKGKTGFMIADFGLAAYDLYSSLRKVTPRSNIGASLLDLVGINLNNFVADMLNNPGMLREYVSVTNDPNAINVNRNREIINENIRKIKEQNKKDFTGADITEGSITGKQMRENMKNYFTNPQTYNPFSTYQVKPNPDLFTKPSGDPNDDVLSIFQSAAMEAN